PRSWRSSPRTDARRSAGGPSPPGAPAPRPRPMDQAPRRPVPVFPLPGVVLFPGAEMSLHVFELRYRTMVRDALSGERRIGLATLAPGWERDYEASPAFHALGCVARFEDVSWLPNDCYDLRVRGTLRVRFGRPASGSTGQATRRTPSPTRCARWRGSRCSR